MGLGEHLDLSFHFSDAKINAQRHPHPTILPPHACTVQEKFAGENGCPAPRLLHVGIDLAVRCINVRPPLLRSGEGQEMLSVVNILLYR